ncbi:MAG: hypothetical protein D6679_07920 [Candidatus Hydrogenedentota bacterium]|nr:MAG: hypothetical protein D6679_07920 [Candidatus Hydrogenedentota bacterium]
MENFGHFGILTPPEKGIGNFTLYDWGPGSACKAWCRIRDHYGDAYVDLGRNRAFGINSVSVDLDKRNILVRDASVGTDGRSRDIKVVFSDGKERNIELPREGKVEIPKAI